ncbi:NHLP bacteriocin export ABC transporter permease/ATPase subunit [Brasilonema sp. UFV-L1]|uniref:NHLP bacteriocin export ABC transporter permease/ATPase subunit n=1 Tax=Brasilonema sp. UFV-L1 TaxID=2234130 RepID=UPI00145EDDFE|nr:NHLP bacteriocin export ABC transporter permease/ATPase subunit [Brasilonema sp. UFV-L1]NMG11620.1 NHLP bacteriocin export ABC transporter permease/ATPase subunit [Brasilonema sp. UFV-L1]
MLFKGNEPLLLNDPQTVWVVQSGSMSLFAIAVNNGNPEGKRRYLFSVKSAEAMFSTAPEPQSKQLQILAVSLEETELLRMSRKDFESMLANKQGYAIDLVERWIYQLGSAVASEPNHNLKVPEPGIQFFSFANGDIFRPEKGSVSWVQIQRGYAKLMGFSELVFEPASGLLPLSADMWLQAEDTLELESLRTEDIPEADALMVSLAQLQMDFLQMINLLFRQEIQQEIQRCREREHLKRQVMNETLGELSSVLQQRETATSPQMIHGSNSSYQALLVAAGAVGHALGIAICPPAQSEDFKRLKDPLEAIARASRIRMRRLHLVGNWWKSDCGPMLGYTLEDESLVALLPVKGNAAFGSRARGNSYEIFDPLKQTRTPVDEQSAAMLSTTAHVFYRPLPDKDLNTWDILRFALRGHFKDVVVILLTGIAVSLLGMVTPQATAILMDNAILDTDRGLLLQIALGLCATAFGSTIFQLAQGLALMRLETFADSSVQAAVWDRLLKLKMSFFNQYSIGDLESRVSAISDIRSKLSGTVLKSIFSGVFAFLNLGLLIYYNGSLALIGIVAAVVNITLTFISSILTLHKLHPLLELQGKIFGVMVELINGVAKLQVVGAEEHAFAYWGKQYSQQLKLTLSIQVIEDLLAVGNQVLPIFTSCALFWFTANLLQESQQTEEGQALSIGTFLAFNSAFGTFISGATSLSTTVVDVLEVIPLWKRVQPILQAEPEVNNTKADPDRLSGRIFVDHVVFRYRDDGPLNLDDVSIRAEPGEFIALVGTSGSGKSTLFRLLLGFETPAKGSIYYDGQDLTGLDIHAVRRQLGVVLQNSRLMSASIFENIASSANVSIDEAWEAAEMAGFADDVQAMPMGMHTIVSEGGGNISGGQRQRLLIARALVLKPRILLFDEATSALDNRTQAIVSESLNQLKVTRIVIAHRLSTIRSADCIYVLQDGRVVQQGSFERLANQQGLFAQLMMRQKL